VSMLENMSIPERYPHHIFQAPNLQSTQYSLHNTGSNNDS